MLLKELIEILQSEPYNPNAEVNLYFLSTGDRIPLDAESIDFDVRDTIDINIDTDTLKK